MTVKGEDRNPSKPNATSTSKEILPVFVWETGQHYPGRGIVHSMACFTTLGVHVPFIYEYRMPETDLVKDGVGGALPCDGTCIGKLGQLLDFNAKRSDHEYNTEPIKERALYLAEKIPK